MKIFLGRSWLLALCAWSSAATIHAAEHLRFDTHGGDAWTFEKHITGRTDDTCDEIRIDGPAGSIAAVITSDRFFADVPLRAGVNELRAICKQRGSEIERSDPKRWTVRMEDRPRAWARMRLVGNDTIVLDAGRSEPAPGIAAPIIHYDWRARPGNPGSLTLFTDRPALDSAPANEQTLQIRSPLHDGDYFVTLKVTDALGRSDSTTTVFQVVAGQAREIAAVDYRPEWSRNAVLYGITPFAFSGHSYEEVRARLRDIAALGATAIWLSPITAAPGDDFGYAVTDHFLPRAEFGSEKQLRALIDAAHAFGLRVIIDFIPNHFSTENRYYSDADREQRASAYFDWFERDTAGAPTHYFDWPHLKNLDYDNPEVGSYMLAAFSHWVREFDVDGFRVDVSWGVRERAPEFWPRWREELKRIDPDLLLIAEASALDRFYVEHGFDTAYDWTTQLGQWAWHDVFVDAGTRPHLDRLRAALLTTSDLPAGAVLRFLNNNDTGARFITRYGKDQARVAAAMLLTLPGLPLIYNGDEVGAQFQPYEQKPIVWRDRHGLTPWYARLVQLRKSVPALRSANLQLLQTNRDDVVLAYLRKPDPPHDVNNCEAARAVIVLLNFSAEQIDARLPKHAHIEALQSSTLRDLLSEATIDLTTDGIRLAPYDVRMIAARPESCANEAKR